MRLYVAYCGSPLTLDELAALFRGFGEITGIELLKSAPVAGRFHGAFVEMRNLGDARSAMNALNGEQSAGRKLTILAALPRPRARPRLAGR